ncbi:hypothetical protein DENSPDRAFT_454596 [Dentipellis sp. KUC8613]|nr:hypothetical protein DENSPDRAFT_454596 [Dentipellis sp. KUC8613]
MRSILALEKDAVVQVLSSPRIHYNALAPTNHLPPEVLVHTISFLQVADRPSVIRHDSHPTDCDIGWIYATHVCHHWRIIVLDLSSLFRCVGLHQN